MYALLMRRSGLLYLETSTVGGRGMGEGMGEGEGMFWGTYGGRSDLTRSQLSACIVYQKSKRTKQNIWDIVNLTEMLIINSF